MMRAGRRSRPGACRAWAAVLAAVAVLALAVTASACTVIDREVPADASGRGAPRDPAGSSSARTPDPAPVATRSSVNRVDGRLTVEDRSELLDRVTRAIDTWIDAAYAGTYPRDDFSGAFSSFSEGARDRVADDESVMSNATIAASLDDVRPLRRRVRLDVLAVDGAAAAVTARVDLAFELSGQLTRTDRVWGSLYLTHVGAGDPAGWRVFGYDVQRREIR